MKASEVRELTDKEIVERIEAEKTNLLKLKLNHSISPLDNPMKIKESRRTIARLKTILTQRKLSQNQ
ncbi:MAG TPA: 50S ribosomal protein L29 [Tenuifilaceae bacterium]|jgi:large subunit ribosomal protein L29|nr:50S ribosomal protein L29 [Bacteroidales bacterium]HNT41305.1 50S ribosomal protein L29 [Tenuifilaceae bacterium]MBP8643164.1 50S ribosomal protein L29 [Bacteroidales bacterium]NLI86915.1 50S ribosomal protein L29 [Bacteroidales bacterium]HNY09490.1 50S ribosomal protein L29 [Tenuifilaceae bacterium]